MFDLTLLFFANFDHDLLDSVVHFLAELVFTNTLCDKPRVLGEVVQTYAFFGIGVQHLLDQVSVTE